MNSARLGGGERARSLIAIIATAAIAALGGAALRRWRLRQSASAKLTDAATLEEDEIAEYLAAGSGAKRPIDQGVLIGSFQDESDAVRAMKKIRQAWPQGFEAYSPELNEHFLEAMALPKSPTRFWILAGAIFGQFSGWAITIMLSVYWPHKVGNMPVVAIPPFTILSFELMVLMAVFGGVFGLLYHAGMPRFDAPPEYVQRFRRDRIGIAMNCRGESQFRQAESMLQELGAEDIVRA